MAKFLILVSVLTHAATTHAYSSAPAGPEFQVHTTSVGTQYGPKVEMNAADDHAYHLTATDGQVSGGGGTDRFRIKIWSKSGGGVIYDNQPGASDDADATTELGGGSIVIHKP